MKIFSILVVTITSFLNGFFVEKRMDYTHLLLRCGEIFLKGKNKKVFENKLISNIKKIAGVKDVKNVRGRFVVNYFEEHKKIRLVFGLRSYSPAVKIPKDADLIKNAALELIKTKRGKKSFKVVTKRADKTFPIESPAFNVLVGQYIEAESKLYFDFEAPEIILNIEINTGGAYLFTEIIDCFGGLPTGVEGKAHLLVENEASLLAGLLMMKRGCTVVPVSLDECDISLLQKFSPRKLELRAINSLDDIEEGILVVGQTFDNYKKFEGKVLVLRPLVAYSDKMIKEEAARFLN